jgi:hypothetical protein
MECCARPTGGSHALTKDAPEQRFNGTNLRGTLERVMNLGENRIGMRIPQSLGSLVISVSRIPMPFLTEFITRSRSVAENPGSEYGSRALDQETELQISGKSRSVSLARRRYV